MQNTCIYLWFLCLDLGLVGVLLLRLLTQSRLLFLEHANYIAVHLQSVGECIYIIACSLSGVALLVCVCVCVCVCLVICEERDREKGVRRVGRAFVHITRAATHVQ